MLESGSNPDADQRARVDVQKCCKCISVPKLPSHNNTMATADALADVIEVLRARRQCRQCREWYTEFESLGAHRCRRHAGYVQSVQEDYGKQLDTYTCCGVSPYGWHPAYRGVDAARGCIECDHTDVDGLPSDITMPVDRAQVLFSHHLRDRDVILNETRSHIIIRREAASSS